MCRKPVDQTAVHIIMADVRLHTQDIFCWINRVDAVDKQRYHFGGGMLHPITEDNLYMYGVLKSLFCINPWMAFLHLLQICLQFDHIAVKVQFCG